MTKSLLLGTLLGGLTAFAWSMVSWELVGWHEKTMAGFQNEDEVAAVIAPHASSDGPYILASVPRVEGMAPEQKKQTEAAMAKFQKGPIVIASVRRGGFGSSGQAIALQVLSLMAGAFLLTWLVL